MPCWMLYTANCLSLPDTTLLATLHQKQECCQHREHWASLFAPNWLSIIRLLSLFVFVCCWTMVHAKQLKAKIILNQREEEHQSGHATSYIPLCCWNPKIQNCQRQCSASFLLSLKALLPKHWFKSMTNFSCIQRTLCRMAFFHAMLVRPLKNLVVRPLWSRKGETVHSRVQVEGARSEGFVGKLIKWALQPMKSMWGLPFQ